MGTFRGHARAVLVIGSLVGCRETAEGGHPSRHDCAQLREHLIEVRMRAVTLDRPAHRASIEASFGDGFVGECVATMSPSQVRCGRAAADAAALAACASR